MKKMLVGYVLFLSVLIAFLFGNRISLLRTDNYYKYKNEDGTRYVAKAEGTGFSIYEDGGWRELFVAGVNLGSGKPGYYPGEFGATKEDYLRWFQEISDMNANTIRVYVLQMPGFYQAFKEYNETAEKPLYLIHGVYLNEADIAAYQDAYAEDGLIYNTFLQDIRNVVDAIHGKAVIRKAPGHAGGTYATDVSRYVIGWILGIEWEAEFVQTTNENNPSYTSYDGEYVQTGEVTPFEVMLAEAADTAISYEMRHYREQRPVAISNWVTSDPLEHPGEPNPEVEDAISIDAEHLRPKEGFEAGFFASYHIYPYYPDLFNYAPELLMDDPPNSYRAYLRQLKEHHSMPVLVSEVGIPASRGIAHRNIHSGFDQGNVTEEEQGAFLVSLMGDIYAEDMMGAIAFSWQDEWFKKTWNTQDVDLADRRAFWMDYQTNEQSFGLLSFDPGEGQSVCYVDGDVTEWSAQDRVLEHGGQTLSMKSDEKFLYLMLETDSFGEKPLYLPIDVMAGQGNTKYNGAALGMGADFLLVLDGKEESVLLIDPYYDATYYEYAIKSHIIERDAARERTDTGRFIPITLMLSRGIYLADTGKTVPYEIFETGKLRYGVANPALEGYNSIADFCAGDGVVELRLPWLLLNINDPSGKKAVGDLYKNGGAVGQSIESIGIGLLAQGEETAASPARYRWQGWEVPTYHERLKQSYPMLREFYGGIEQSARLARTPAELFWGRWNQVQFSNIGFWFPIQPVLNYSLAFLLSVIVYFFLALLFIHTRSAIRTARQKALERRILATLEDKKALEHAAKTNTGIRIKGMRTPFSRNGLITFSRLIGQAAPREKKKIRALMLAMQYEDFVGSQMKTRDIGYLILLVRLIGELGLTSQADAVKEMLYTYKQDTDLQYQGMLTLSALGAYEHIVAISQDQSFVQTLSYRSLQEIAKAYQGDKQALYSALLDSPDMFTQRIALKRIGVERHTRLAGKLLPYLDAENYNVVIDAVRSLGQLSNAEAAPIIADLLEHARWEVRAVAVTALAEIDMRTYENLIVQALGDPEWTVRNNAATALSRTPHADLILQDVEQSGDRYAFEMLRYMMETQEIWGVRV